MTWGPSVKTSAPTITCSPITRLMGKRPQSISGLTCSIITRELKFFAYISSHRLFRILSQLQLINSNNIYNELSTIDTLHNTCSIAGSA